MYKRTKTTAVPREINSETFMAILHECLNAIDTQRFYANERGYQGKLLAELDRRIGTLALGPQAIVEQEHQKVFSKHGLANRPDIIVHEPYDPVRHAGRREGNYVVIELKRAASAKRASTDLENIAKVLDALDYRLGVFVNVHSKKTYVELVPERARGRVICFAVSLTDAGSVSIVEQRSK